jgi:murein DD-endopeptidase MepM/ murein hydrolase activator NlpD
VKFIDPTKGEGRKSSSYGPRGNHFHAGLDFAMPLGKPIVAAQAGRVVAALGTEQSGGYGNYVRIQHSATRFTAYAHLSRIDVAVGTPVAAGQVIGLSGNTGQSIGPHLHFEVLKANDWGRQHNTLDPDPLINYGTSTVTLVVGLLLVLGAGYTSYRLLS